MGSKVSMLAGTLGEALLQLAPRATRFVDLFAGSGAVSRYVATSTDVPVISVDLMRFSGAITAATTERTAPINAESMMESWTRRADHWLDDYSDYVAAAMALSQPQSAEDAAAARELCAAKISGAFIWSDYGGHYFSPLQALRLSAYYATMPQRAPHRIVALAALLRTASRASASPGHTAQPFQPTKRLLPHLRSAWRTDIGTELTRQVNAIAQAPARALGTVVTGDSVTFANRRIADGDLVFCDPPYSEAQYSRFYHVLEGIAIGGWQSVSGAGRAPAGAERVSSDFSRRTRSVQATDALIKALAKKRTTVLWTYPEGDRSNGLTVDHIREAARTDFSVRESRIPMRHSTLGGSEANHEQRLGRRDLHEILFVLERKRSL